MKYFVWYSVGKFDAEQLAVFDDEVTVIDLLNMHAGNPAFTFRVVRGEEIEFVAKTVATRYARAEATAHR